jgi:pyruvate formate lyase activating enzyme
VYVGNVPGHEAEHTYCPKCGKKILARSGYRIAAIDMRGDSCRFCGEKIPGIWREE